MTTPQSPPDDDPKTQELDTAKLRSPEEGADEGSSPIHDELASKTAQGSVTTTTTVTTDVTQSDAPSIDEDEDGEGDEVEEAPETAKAYKIDVQRALDRKTDDGKGDEDPGESDWNGYATEGVEEEEDV